jgi:hypothetical protein
MPIDPRIALAGVSPTYDFMGAYNTSRAAAQTAQANQMAMQAAETTATAQRNAMLEAQTLDPTNQAALRAYALRNPAAAEQVLGGLASADNIFSARNTDTRAQAEAATKQSEAYMAQLPQFASQLLGDASPPVIARVRAQWEGSGFPVGVFDALATRLADLPPEQQQQAIQSYLLTTGGGKTAVETRFGPRTLVNTGATQEARNLNPLALDAATGAPVPVTGPIQNTADPRAPTLMEDASGNVYRVPSAGGAATPVTTEGGGQLTARVPGAEGQITAQRRGQLQGQINTVNNDVIPALDRMDVLLTTGDVITGAGAELRLQAARGLAFAGNRDAQRQVAATQEYQNLAKSLAAGMAKTLGSNPSNADVALLTQVTGGMIGQETPALQATSAALRSRASGLVVDAQDMLGIEAAPAANDRAALIAEARRRGLDVE